MKLYLKAEMEIFLILFLGLNLKIIVKINLSWQNKQNFLFLTQMERSLEHTI